MRITSKTWKKDTDDLFNFDTEEVEMKNSAFDIITENYRVMFAGSGDSCEINRFSCETEFKEDYDYFGCCYSLYYYLINYSH